MLMNSWTGKKENNMELEFDVKITAGTLYDYLLQHTYSSFSGMLGTLVGALLIVFFVATKYPVYLIHSPNHVRCPSQLKAHHLTQNSKD